MQIPIASENDCSLTSTCSTAKVSWTGQPRDFPAFTCINAEPAIRERWGSDLDKRGYQTTSWENEIWGLESYLSWICLWSDTQGSAWTWYLQDAKPKDPLRSAHRHTFPTLRLCVGLLFGLTRPFFKSPSSVLNLSYRGSVKIPFSQRFFILLARFIPSFLQARIASSGFSRLLSLYFSWDFIKKMKIFIDSLHEGKRIVDHMCNSAHVGFPWPEESSRLGSASSPASPSSGKRVTVPHKWCPLAGLGQAPSPRMASSGLETHSLIQ